MEQTNKQKPKKFYKDVGLALDPNKVIGQRKKKTKENKTSDFVRKLEEKANKPRKQKFKFGKEMCKELEYYINTYGDNYEAMARDKKNLYQDSPVPGKIDKFVIIAPAMPPPTTYFTFLINRFGLAYKSISALSEKRIVSKPQILSRLRHVNIIERCDETNQERAYRLQYESLQDWNNKYWAENNELFTREKNEYIERIFGKDANKEEALSHDQLADFYQTFLERNRDKHVNYNRIWYRNHIALLGSSISAKLSRLRTMMSANQS